MPRLRACQIETILNAQRVWLSSMIEFRTHAWRLADRGARGSGVCPLPRRGGVAVGVARESRVSRARGPRRPPFYRSLLLTAYTSGRRLPPYACTGDTYILMTYCVRYVERQCTLAGPRRALSRLASLRWPHAHAAQHMAALFEAEHDSARCRQRGNSTAKATADAAHSCLHSAPSRQYCTPHRRQAAVHRVELRRTAEDVLSRAPRRRRRRRRTRATGLAEEGRGFRCGGAARGPRPTPCASAANQHTRCRSSAGIGEGIPHARQAER